MEDSGGALAVIMEHASMLHLSATTEFMFKQHPYYMTQQIKYHWKVYIEIPNKLELSYALESLLNTMEPTDSLAREQSEPVQLDWQLLAAVLKALVSRRISVAQ